MTGLGMLASIRFIPNHRGVGRRSVSIFSCTMGRSSQTILFEPRNSSSIIKSQSYGPIRQILHPEATKPTKLLTWVNTMSDQRPQSENRPRRQGGQNRQRNRKPRRDGEDGPRSSHETYRREGGPSDYTPPRENRRTTFGGGEYERVYRDKPAPKKPLGKRFLSLISFGLLGKDKPASAPAKNHSKSAKPQDRGDRRPDRRGGESRPERGPRTPRNGDRPQEPRQSGPREPRQRTERPSPAPLDSSSITTARLHIGNLSYDTTESDLFELFNGFGKVTNAEIVTHTRTQRSKGFGFVQLTTLEEAKRAAEELHGKPFMGRAITVGPAKGPKPDPRPQDHSPVDSSEPADKEA